MLLKNLLSLTAISSLLIGCSSTREVLETGTPATFVSTLSAPKLTRCIDGNTDGAVLNSLRTNIKYSDAISSEIVVRNGAFVYAVIRVQTTDSGSVATFRLGGAATITPESSLKKMTEGCE